MRLMEEAAGMLSMGTRLVADELVLIAPPREGVSRQSLERVDTGTGVFYDLVIDEGPGAGESLRFTDPLQAVSRFTRLIDRPVLLRIISTHRYRYLFPMGSSLGWAPARLCSLA
jgi:hypothetical protein